MRKINQTQQPDEGTAVGTTSAPPTQELGKSIRRILRTQDPHAMVALLVGGGLLAIFAIVFPVVAYLSAAPKKQLAEESENTSLSIANASTATASSVPTFIQERPVSIIFGLTVYKFYAGFMSSTWLPFLIAKEGSNLIPSHQSAFMGYCKLIYGFALFLNPVTGLLSDRITAQSKSIGRSSFLMAGCMLALTGIYAASIAASNQHLGQYYGACILWMLGEALVDVTLEACMPELTAPSQYEVTGAVRSLNFLFGGFTGYLVLFTVVGHGVEWMYWAYGTLMIICAVPTTLVIHYLERNRDREVRESRPVGFSTFVDAYLGPLRYPGYFPRACLCIFCFSLGSGPIFFTLLFVRDLVGVLEDVPQQEQFSMISMIFLACAAVSSIGTASSKGDAEGDEGQRTSISNDQADAVLTGPAESTGGTGAGQASGRLSSNASSRWGWLLTSLVCYALLCLPLPLTKLPSHTGTRLLVLTTISALMGMSFGSVFARFKVCTWMVLPHNVDMGNAMGFAALAQLTGTGIGNFGVGMLLDLFRTSSGRYAWEGYCYMALGSALAAGTGATLCATIYFAAKRGEV
jgi:hypothetical protein